METLFQICKRFRQILPHGKLSSYISGIGYLIKFQICVKFSVLKKPGAKMFTRNSQLCWQWSQKSAREESEVRIRLDVIRMMFWFLRIQIILVEWNLASIKMSIMFKLVNKDELSHNHEKSRAWKRYFRFANVFVKFCHMENCRFTFQALDI